MNRIYLLLLSLSLAFSSLLAERLEDQIKMLLPDEDQNRQTERQYFKKAVDDLITSLVVNKVGRKSEKKKIARIQAQIERQFLRRYVPDANLADFFRDGQYNDASLAIVYALVFDHFGIPYKAKVDHWRTSVVGAPGGSKVNLTIPRAPTMTEVKTKAFRYDYVEMLNLTILPAQRPTSSIGVDSLYQRFYYSPQESLDFAQLAAYWHYLRAQHEYRAKEYLKVIRILSVAKQLEDRAAFSALEQATYLQLAELEEEDGKQALFYFFELWNKDPGNTYLPAALLTHFIRVSDPLLEPGADFGRAEQLYTFLDSRGGKRTEWRNQLRELYYLQKSRFYAANGRYDQVLDYVDSLYIMQPNSPVFRKVVGGLTFRAIKASGATGEDLRRKMDQAIQRYPFLVDHPATNDLLLEDQARSIRRLYDADQGYRGDNQLAIFRTQVTQLPPGPRRALWVLTVYVAAANYYDRLGDPTHAQRLVKEGLQYAPEEPYLLHLDDLLKRSF
ncbi:MAG: hypothetical protein AAFQ37_01065 [Bacteroidota bacterium]